MRQAVSLWRAMQTQAWRSGERRRRRAHACATTARRSTTWSRCCARDDERVGGHWFAERGSRRSSWATSDIAPDPSGGRRGGARAHRRRPAPVPEPPQPPLRAPGRRRSEEWVERYAASAAPMNDGMRTPPNILYLHSHDTGRYVQPYGHQIPTPNIQLLADQGVLFRKAFCGGADLLGQPRAPSPPASTPHSQRDDRARPPRLRAARLRPPHRAHAAPRPATTPS